MSRRLIGLALLLQACQQGREMKHWIQSWPGTDAAQLLEALPKAFPESASDDRRAALESVARGDYSSASTNAAAALCRLAGLGNPCDTANRIYNELRLEPTEPQWFLWIAGYSYNWICSSGLSACYFGFDDRQFADRIRVYDAIGANMAAQVLREADLAFGADGPGATLEARQAKISDALHARLDALSPRFWACGDEIYTRAFLYALEHPDDFCVGM